jgi:hypothetical protein
LNEKGRARTKRRPGRRAFLTVKRAFFKLYPKSRRDASGGAFLSKIWRKFFRVANVFAAVKRVTTAARLAWAQNKNFCATFSFSSSFITLKARRERCATFKTCYNEIGRAY